MAALLDPSGCLSSFGNQSWRRYELKGKNYEDAKQNGFSLDTMDQYNLWKRSGFIFADTAEQLELRIKEYDFIKNYGPKVKNEFDFSCPACGWHFCAPCAIGGEYDSFCEEKHIAVSCICGIKFRADIEYIITPKISLTKL